MKRSGFFIMSKKLFIKGTLLLTFAGLLSRLMGFFYRIFLSHTIGAHGLGIFQLILPLQILIMSICASGIQTAISRLTAAEKVSKNPSRHISDYFVVGTVFSVVFSLVFSWFLYSYADFWAVQILKESQTSGLIRILSLSIPLSTLHTCISSYYLGRKQAGFPAGSGTAFPHRRMLYSLSDLCIARAKHHSGNCSRRKSYRGNSLIFYFSFRSQYAF